MKCVRCESKLEVRPLADVEIDVCPGCGGVWLDAGELSRLREMRDTGFDADQKAKARELADMGKASTAPTAQHDLVCPRCGEHLATTCYGYSSDIHMDRCGACEGIWLDRGELEAVHKQLTQWDQSLAGDLAQYGDVLERTRSMTESKLAQADPRQRSLLRGLFSFLGL